MIKVMEKYEQHKDLGTKVCQRLIAEMHKTGFSEKELTALPRYEDAEFQLEKDPYTMEENLIGAWLDKDGYKSGNIQFLSDGSFYAEFDVVKPHPSKPQWFVEAVTAWGREGDITAEAKLLPVAE